MTNSIPIEYIQKRIYEIRGVKVMLDYDLAELYGVETKQLKRQVKRNIKRFPEGFMFQLTSQEFKNLRCQFGTSSWGGTRYHPMAFTEHGVAMLSSVLNSERAIHANIQIIKAFVGLRKMLTQYDGLVKKIESMEQKYDKQFQVVFTAIKQLMEPSRTIHVRGFQSRKKDH